MTLASLALDLLLLARKNSEVATVGQLFSGQSVVALVMLLEEVTSKVVMLTLDLSEEV